jgi:hypothetical protein
LSITLEIFVLFKLGGEHLVDTAGNFAAEALDLAPARLKLRGSFL